MPIKYKPSQTVKDKQTGKLVTEHFYIKNAKFQDLEDLITADNTKPKLRIKCQREIIRRVKRIKV